LPKNDVTNLSQISTIDKLRLLEKPESISNSNQQKVDEGIELILDLRL
jgi:mRNA-degrading endonuclease toxin of MazEF toxin-antitoxin module